MLSDAEKLSAPPGRDSFLVRMIGGAWMDLRHAGRRLVKSRGFTLVTILTLALCIGANTAIYSGLYAIMLKPMPFPEPDRLVDIYNSYPKQGMNKFPSNVVQYLDYRQNGTSYEHVGLWTPFRGMVGEDGGTERLSGALMSADMFDVLKVKPVLGRFFTEENNRQGADKLVVLAQLYWQTEFQEDPAVLGRTLRIDGMLHTITGVAPRALEALDARVRYILPLAWPADINPLGRHSSSLQFHGRLKPGVTIERAQAEVDLVEKRFYDSTNPQMRTFLDRSGHRMWVNGLHTERVKPMKTALFLLQGGVLLVLLIGSVNVANLMLARANGRQAELAIRCALGASRGMIARQLLMESLLLTVIGAALGLALGWGGVQGFNRYNAQVMPNMTPYAIDGHVLGFTILVSVVVALFIGLLPVVHILRANLMALIHRSTRSSSGGVGVRTVSSILVVGQVAIALMLLIGAGLLIHSFMKAIAVDPGFDPDGVVVGRIAIPAAHRGSDQAGRGLQDRLVQSLKEIPSVTGVALSLAIPFQGGLPVNTLVLADDVLPAGSPQPSAFRVGVSPEYAATARLGLVEGRFYEPADLAPNQRFFVVDETFARRYFPNRSAVGGRFAFGTPPAKESDWPTVIGVVRNVPHNGIEERSGQPFVYQLLPPRANGLTFFVRTPRPTAEVIAVIREKVRAIDPAIALYETGTLQSFVDRSFIGRRAMMVQLVTFAGLALFLSALGVYGVLAYDVSQRTQEIGIRGAIGASRRQVIGLILRQGLWKTGLGLALGLIGAVLLSRYITTQLYEVKPTDPAAYASVTILLLLVGLLASYLPALRAARIDPIVALRQE